MARLFALAALAQKSSMRFGDTEPGAAPIEAAE
jgi:hypothetical protein